MKNTLTFIGLLGLLLAAGSAFAQSKRIQANIPFDFMVNEEILPAGGYQLKPLHTSGSPNILLIRDSNGVGKMMILSRPVKSLEASANTKLVFYRYGDRYFLKQIWMQGEAWGRRLPKSRPEQRIAMGHSSGRVVVLAELR